MVTDFGFRRGISDSDSDCKLYEWFVSGGINFSAIEGTSRRLRNKGCFNSSTDQSRNVKFRFINLNMHVHTTQVYLFIK